MHAEVLLGLQQAYADLCELYQAARVFTPLRARAEREFLPRLHALAAELRAASRHQLEGAMVGHLANELHGFASLLQREVEHIRTTATYTAATVAYREENFPALETLLPRIFADLQPAPRPPQLLCPFDAARKHRRAGQPPFLSPEQCAQELATLVDRGISVEGEGGPWWYTDFPFVLCASEPAALSSPIWLAFAAQRLAAAVLADASNPSGWRVFTKTLVGPVAVGVAEETDDEWWVAQDPPFTEYRQRLISALRELRVSIEPHNQLPTLP